MQIAHFVNIGSDLQYKFSQDSLTGKIHNRSQAAKPLQSHALIVQPKTEMVYQTNATLHYESNQNAGQDTKLNHKISANRLEH